MSSNTKYWKGIEELHSTPEFEQNKNNEFPAEIPVEEFLGDSKLGETAHSRRDFLKFLGFSVAAATLAACEAPVTKSVPYTNKPEDVTPGIANWYASAYYDGNSFANILVKTREARPIFVKGNKHHGITKAATNPRVLASVLSLYDSARLKGPKAEGDDASWDYVDKHISDELTAIAKNGGKIRVVSNTVISPTALGAIEDLKARYSASSSKPAPVAADVQDDVELDENGNPVVVDAEALNVQEAPVEMTSSIESVGNADFKHITFDSVSYNAIRIANKKCFNKVDDQGQGVIPDYDFSKAKTIVSIGADFLATWLNATEYAPQYGLGRRPESVKHDGWMSKHFQFEANMSITGANADVRVPVKPSQYAAIASGILEGLGGSGAGLDSSEFSDQIADVVSTLKASGSESLVVAGSNDVGLQMLVNAINEKLGAYTSTINLDNPVMTFRGNDAQVSELMSNIKDVDAVLFIDCNPVYSLPNGKELVEAIKSVKLSVSTALYADETASSCKYICPTHHYMEAWNDYQPKQSYYSVAQPVIRPLFDTRHWAESMWVWAGATENDGKDSTFMHDQIKHNWVKYGFEMDPNKDAYVDGNDYWNWMVHNGGGATYSKQGTAPSMNSGAVAEAKTLLANSKADGEWEIQLYQKNGIGDGTMANNPWLQEMPDPVTTVTWDNYVTMSPEDMDAKGFNVYLGQESPASLVEVKVGETTMKLPVVSQPGQAKGTIGVALGYGRGEFLGESDEERYAIGKGAYATGEFGEPDRDGNTIKPIGANAFQTMSLVNAVFAQHMSASISDTGETYPIAATQSHHTVMGRHSIVKETSLDFYKNGWKETNYASAMNREGFNPKHSMVVHENVGGAVDEDGKILLDEFHNPIPDKDGVIDANDRKHISSFDLWNEHPVEKVGHRWGMTIDLSSCIGCGNCIVACQAENNVPVVGKDEVRRVRIMHWMRIDRYYKSEVEDFIGTRKEENQKDYKAMEVPASNPSVIFQPMMCQHCNHAPCETVCPVVATTHSNEGLNQMTYNRCIGTRYCANNCPYKVRRFNWFNYPSYKKFTNINPSQDDMGRMVLNPDVVVRTRGVMEKCSLCVQSIQEGKLKAKKDNRPVVDGDIETACQGSCPTNAIIFGDLNDMKEEYKDENTGEKMSRKGSAVYNSAMDDRSYQVLEEVGTKPNIFYKVKVRNIDDPLMTDEEIKEGHFIYKPAKKSEGHGGH